MQQEDQMFFHRNTAYLRHDTAVCNLGVVQELLCRDGPDRPAGRSSKSSAGVLLAIFNTHVLTVLFSHRQKLVAL